MALTATDSTSESRAFSLGPLKLQIMDYVARGGDTSGTITADKLSRLMHVVVGEGSMRFTAAPTYATNVATLAFTVPATVLASAVIQDLTYTAVPLDSDGNLVSVAYVDDGTATEETVDVSGDAIIVHIEAGVSTADDIKAAIEASVEASALVTITVSGTGTNTQTAVEATLLEGGSGGAHGTVLCIGI